MPEIHRLNIEIRRVEEGVRVIGRLRFMMSSRALSTNAKVGMLKFKALIHKK